MRTKEAAGAAAIEPNVAGPAVRKLRIKAGLTQKELAARCEEKGLALTRGTLAKIESQTRFVTADELFIIAKVLAVRLERFFPPGYGERKPDAPCERG